MALSPLNQRRWRNFKANKRAYWSLILFAALFVLSLFAEVLANGPYDVVHFNMGLHGWQEGRIKPGTFEPLTKAYVEVLKTKLPNAT